MENGSMMRSWSRRWLTALGVALALAGGGLQAQVRSFETPDQAMLAFGDALALSDEDALKALLGADFRRYIPPSGAEVRYRFLEAWARFHRTREQGDGKAVLEVGGDGWTLPIPIVRGPQGWRFETKAGAEEMLVRRIGRNEHAVIQVMLAIVDAQREYALLDPNGDGIAEYARRFDSTRGRRDGLYWPADAGAAPSPLGPAIAAARATSTVAMSGTAEGYYGYRFRLITTGQGSHAQGGAYDYVAGGRLIGGFAVVAWPVVYGDTGVMTFMVNHDGIVYEKDLGRDTASRARSIVRFDPSSGWRAVAPD
jgi:hypothetical protein